MRFRRNYPTIRAVFVTFVVIGIFLTFLKWGLNHLSWNIDPLAPSRSYEEAKRKNLIMRLQIEPTEFDWNGKKVKLGDAWIERRVSMEYWFVWFRHYKDEGGYYLTFITKGGEEVFFEGNEPNFRFCSSKKSFMSRKTRNMSVTFSAFSEGPYAIPSSIELVSDPSSGYEKSLLFTVRKLPD